MTNLPTSGYCAGADPASDPDHNDLITATTVTIELCIGLHGVCVVSLLGDEWDWVDSDLASNGTDAWYDRLPEHDKPIQGAYSIECRVTQHEEDDRLTYEVISSGPVNPKNWDSSWSDSEKETPTPADYYELQKQHDQLQTELFNAQKKLAGYSETNKSVEDSDRAGN